MSKEEQVAIINGVDKDTWIYREHTEGMGQILTGIHKISELNSLGNRFYSNCYIERDKEIIYESDRISKLNYTVSMSIATPEQIKYFTKGKEHNSLEDTYPLL